MINELRRASNINPSELILPTTLGPITVQSLNVLEGWRYDLFTLGFPGIEPPIVLGGPPVTLANYTDEKGWVLMLGAIFRSPYAQINFTCDNYIFSYNPWYLNLMGLVGPQNGQTFFATPYNPATPIGPIYGVMYTPGVAQPYASRLLVTMDLPPGVPVAATTVRAAFMGKIWIVDQLTFLKSVKRHIAEQMSGRRIDRYI